MEHVNECVETVFVLRHPDLEFGNRSCRVNRQFHLAAHHIMFTQAVKEYPVVLMRLECCLVVRQRLLKLTASGQYESEIVTLVDDNYLGRLTTTMLAG